MDTLVQHLQAFSLIDYMVMLVNITLMVFARPILTRFSSASVPTKTLNFRISLLRVLNFVILVVYGYLYFYKPTDGDPVAVKTLGILAVLYLTNISNYSLQYAISKYYGKSREIDEKTIYIETYQTRVLSLMVMVVLTVIAIVSIVRILGFDSMLEAGGVIGIIGVFLGLTQSSWAPDIISGLIILNSDMFEEGDIIETHDGILGRVFKTKIFHTEILNISNNHRIMIRNFNVRDKVIHNLSKFASGRGLRECLRFNIDYDTSSSAVRAMFQEAFDKTLEAKVPIEPNTDIEVKLLEAGDHALTWGVFYHIKSVENILSIRRDFREQILESSKRAGVSLATPFTHLDVSRPSNPSATQSDAEKVDQAS